MFGLAWWQDNVCRFLRLIEASWGWPHPECQDASRRRVWRRAARTRVRELLEHHARNARSANVQLQGEHEVKSLLRRHNVTVHALKLTKSGHPQHPLYLRSDTVPFVWIAPTREVPALGDATSDTER